MKKVKKILGLGRKKNGQRSPLRSRVAACASAPGALICSGGDGYNLPNKDLSKLHQRRPKRPRGTPPPPAEARPQRAGCSRQAVECQQEFCAIYLLEHGADPNLKDVDNNTALHFAACNSSVSLAKYLLEKKADIEAQNKDGCTPLIVAVAENNREMVEFFLQQKASVHATDKLGRIPLLIAASNKKRDLTHVLLLHGSNVAHRDKSGWSAKDYAMISDDSINSEKTDDDSWLSSEEEELGSSPK
ncbi:hypothetical protein E2320_006050, partial [Naja naja]